MFAFDTFFIIFKIMKKYFFISNRQSGKTHLSVYEFLKDPAKSLLITYNNRSKADLIDLDLVPDIFKNHIICPSDFTEIESKKHIERIIYDEYFFLDVQTRSELINNISGLNLKELFCFSTPKILYDKQIFSFVKEIKKYNRNVSLEDYLNKEELLIELNDLNIKTKNQIANELWDLYYNHITDPETIIIHNKFFYNDKIYNLENVSYFPDIDRELTELKGEFIRQA